MFALPLLGLFFFNTVPFPPYTVVRTQTGLASVYWPGDGHSGKTCADGKPFTKERCHIAHRHWPMGSMVRVCSLSTRKCAFSFIGDRGTYGACDDKGMDRWYRCKGKWMIKIRRSDPGTWRGIADLSRCVWKQIGGPGLQRVRLQLIRTPRRRGGTKKRINRKKRNEVHKPKVRVRKPMHRSRRP